MPPPFRGVGGADVDSVRLVDVAEPPLRFDERGVWKCVCKNMIATARAKGLRPSLMKEAACVILRLAFWHVFVGLYQRDPEKLQRTLRSRMAARILHFHSDVPPSRQQLIPIFPLLLGEAVYFSLFHVFPAARMRFVESNFRRRLIGDIYRIVTGVNVCKSSLNSLLLSTFQPTTYDVVKHDKEKDERTHQVANQAVLKMAAAVKLKRAITGIPEEALEEDDDEDADGGADAATAADSGGAAAHPGSRPRKSPAREDAGGGGRGPVSPSAAAASGATHKRGEPMGSPGRLRNGLWGPARRQVDADDVLRRAAARSGANSFDPVDHARRARERLQRQAGAAHEFDLFAVSPLMEQHFGSRARLVRLTEQRRNFIIRRTVPSSLKPLESAKEREQAEEEERRLTFGKLRAPAPPTSARGPGHGRPKAGRTVAVREPPATAR